MSHWVKVREFATRGKARLAGVFSLITIVGGVTAQGLISDRLVIFSNAATTAQNILGHEPLFRLGFTIYMIEMAAQIATTLLFYQLLKPVNKSVAQLSAAFSLVGCTIKIFARVLYLTPVFVLGRAHSFAGFSAEQLQALSLFSLRANDQGAGAALIFFGFNTLLDGYLILRSTFLPRFLGILAMISGILWLTFLSPALGARMFLFAAAIALPGALLMIGWLLIRGVDEQRWRDRASVARASIWM